MKNNQMSPDRQRELEEMVKEFRLTTLNMIYQAGSGHIGGSFSAAEILTTLYFHVMKIDPKRPDWEDRDRLVVSKGHCAPMLYAILAKKGFFSEGKLFTFRRAGSILQGHPDMRKTPGVDMSTGSLGHGLSIGIGIALGRKLSQKSFHTFVLLGDGELDEGQIWEGAMAAAKFKLDCLTAIIDCNRYQLDGATADIMPLGNLCSKWEAFGWKVFEIDGHRVEEIAESLCQADKIKNQPSVIIANTIKGKGVSFMENTHIWHGKHIRPEEYELALLELKGK